MPSFVPSIAGGQNRLPDLGVHRGVPLIVPAVDLPVQQVFRACMEDRIATRPAGIGLSRRPSKKPHLVGVVTTCFHNTRLVHVVEMKKQVPLIPFPQGCIVNRWNKWNYVTEYQRGDLDKHLWVGLFGEGIMVAAAWPRCDSKPQVDPLLLYSSPCVSPTRPPHSSATRGTLCQFSPGVTPWGTKRVMVLLAVV